MRELFGKIKDSLRNAMLSPGFENYDPDANYDEYEDEPQVDPGPRSSGRTWQDHAREATAPKAKSSYDDKIVSLYGERKTISTEKGAVVVAHPTDVSTSCQVTDLIREGKICAVNLTGIDRAQAQRIADVIAGAIYALDGSISRISRDIFIVAPEGVSVSNDMKDGLSKDAHLFPWASSI